MSAMWFKLLFVTLLTVPLGAELPAFGPCKTLPTEICNYLEEHGYEEIFPFYEDEGGMHEPPYVYGIEAGEREMTVAVIARRKDGGDSAFLVTMKRKAQFGKEFLKLLELHPVIEADSGGISVEKVTISTLKGWHCLTNEKRKGTSFKQTELFKLSTVYDGAGHEYIFFDGDWWSYFVD